MQSRTVSNSGGPSAISHPRRFDSGGLDCVHCRHGTLPAGAAASPSSATESTRAAGIIRCHPDGQIYCQCPEYWSSRQWFFSASRYRTWQPPSTRWKSPRTRKHQITEQRRLVFKNSTEIANNLVFWLFHNASQHDTALRLIPKRTLFSRRRVFCSPGVELSFPTITIPRDVLLAESEGVLGHTQVFVSASSFAERRSGSLGLLDWNCRGRDLWN
jgi:hypothetical protein